MTFTPITARREFRTDRANNVARGIGVAMTSGKRFTRAEIVVRFINAGYAERLAERKADALIITNTDPDRRTAIGWWETRGTIAGKETYGYTIETRDFLRKF